MAVVTIGGLAYATLMTLFVVPALYDIFNGKKMKAREIEMMKEAAGMQREGFGEEAKPQSQPKAEAPAEESAAKEEAKAEEAEKKAADEKDAPAPPASEKTAAPGNEKTNKRVHIKL